MRQLLRHLRLLAPAALVVVACGGGVTERQTGAIEGIDVSHHQDAIDWSLVAADGIEFAYMKATEGGDHVDTRFCDNWAGAQTYGLVRGAYHFYRPTTDADAQFEHFNALVDVGPGDLPPVLDVEVLDGASEVELIEGLRRWLYRAEVEYGVRPVIYSNLKFYYHHLAGHFDDYPLWIARYERKAPALASTAQLAVWQYGDRGRVAGIEGAVDLNVFVGESHEFDAFCIQSGTQTTIAPMGRALAADGRF